MDRVFFLSPDARVRFLQCAARSLGCAYICLWSPLYSSPSELIPASYFASKGGYWHGEDGDSSGGCRSSSSRRLFDCYRSSPCIIQCSCVPGCAYKSSLPYVELKDSDLLSSASLQVQRQFYQEAGIKTAVFLGCTSGEIEFGITTPNANGNLQSNVHRVFSEEFIQQSLQLGGDQELVPSPAGLLDQSRPSSSSSSLRSLSASSPEYSPRAEAPAATLPHQVAMQALYGRAGGVMPRSAGPGPFPSPSSDEAAMAMAILAVISSNSSSPQTAAAVTDERCAHWGHSGADARRRPVGAFVPYSRAHEAIADAAAFPITHAQKMIKTAMNHLKAVNLMKLKEATKAAAEAVAQEVRPTSTQLHHMISERKRREKLKESFDALRMLLPPGSKKDKASVLASTRKYLNTLKTQMLELEERNRVLLGATTSHQYPRSDQIGGETDSIGIKIESTSDQTQGLDLTLTVGSPEGNLIELILAVLEYLKRTGDDAVHLASVEASTRSPPSNLRVGARFKLRVVKGSDWDEDAFKEGVRKAIDAAVAKSRPSD